VFEQIARHEPLRDLAIRRSHETLHGALEATIRRVARELVAECDYVPIDGGEIVHRSSAAIWAQIERLNTRHTGMTGGDA
jgi:hypothetical protein